MPLESWNHLWRACVDAFSPASAFCKSALSACLPVCMEKMPWSVCLNACSVYTWVVCGWVDLHAGVLFLVRVPVLWWHVISSACTVRIIVLMLTRWCVLSGGSPTS